jgi:tRNA(fMet)-specific endonuclease VapC
MKYMLDTNMCIYIIKKHPSHVLNKLMALTMDDVCISSVTLAELMYGVQKSQHQQKNKAALEEFVSPFEIMPFDDTAATLYGDIRVYLEKKGMPIGPLDLMIASHAQSLNSILVTNNTKEFSRVPNLKIEDWVDS